jgi:plasmid stabilization system protein ParE
MDYGLLLSAEAERSIEDQMIWYETDESNGGSELADRWLDRLEQALECLSQDSERCGLAPENGRWMPYLTVRQMQFKPWKRPSVSRILFVINEQLTQITVLQIRHEKRPLLTEKRRRYKK